MGHEQVLLLQLIVLFCISLLAFRTDAVPVGSSNGADKEASNESEKIPVEGFLVKSVEFEVGVLEDDGVNSTDTSSEPHFVTDKWEETEFALILPSNPVASPIEDKLKTSTSTTDST
ncbi:uncharacterized protein LOC134529702 [Bacillus rossius redtenbacheri]|uniref:uncharacterized protein LOC134529702 n=1 Tax=Bacillus rossius redtenbacheri TaxID=93214 RepID=UPI002FDCC094